MNQITSRKNPVIAHVRKLASSRSYRYEQGQFVCDGRKLYNEALAWGGEIITVLKLSQAEVEVPPGVQVYDISRELLQYVSRMETPNELLFVCRMKHGAVPEKLEKGRHIVLEGIQDPGNMGTILRTAEAFSADSVLLTGGCADPYNPKAVRATMGAIFRQRFYQLETDMLCDMLSQAGIPLYGAALTENAIELQDAELGNAAVAIGSEGSGLSPELLEKCRGQVIIPMSGNAESLNAAIAAAIVLWESRKKQ